MRKLFVLISLVAVLFVPSVSAAGTRSLEGGNGGAPACNASRANWEYVDPYHNHYMCWPRSYWGGYYYEWQYVGTW